MFGEGIIGVGEQFMVVYGVQRSAAATYLAVQLSLFFAATLLILRHRRFLGFRERSV